MSSPEQPSLADRRLRLALTCELDRLLLRLALRPTARRPEIMIGGLPVSAITKAFSVAQFMPGKIGRLARGAALCADLLRAFNPFARSH